MTDRFHPTRPSSAFTLVEAVICTLIVGVMLVGAISTIGASRRSQQGLSDRAAARLLAADLLAEILTKAYAEPDGANSIGPDAGEQSQSRATFDDVDDFHNYEETPPKDLAAAVIPGSEKWSRRVRVEHVNSDNPDQTSLTPTGLKRITVTVTITRDGEPLAQRSAIRAQAADAGRIP
jgi:MSHA pilin protein MshD